MIWTSSIARCTQRHAVVVLKSTNFGFRTMFTSSHHCLCMDRNYFQSDLCTKHAYMHAGHAVSVCVWFCNTSNDGFSPSLCAYTRAPKTMCAWLWTPKNPTIFVHVVDEMKLLRHIFHNKLQPALAVCSLSTLRVYAWKPCNHTK